MGLHPKRSSVSRWPRAQGRLPEKRLQPRSPEGSGALWPRANLQQAKDCVPQTVCGGRSNARTNLPPARANDRRQLFTFLRHSYSLPPFGPPFRLSFCSAASSLPAQSQVWPPETLSGGFGAPQRCPKTPKRCPKEAPKQPQRAGRTSGGAAEL